MRALVRRRDCRELEEMSKNRKSPIGWEVSGTGVPPKAQYRILTRSSAILQRDPRRRQHETRLPLRAEVHDFDNGREDGDVDEMRYMEHPADASPHSLPYLR